ncbi:MAG: NAD(P)H-hydrate dehydratase [Acidobacteriaceae bacterium]|jgi:NAD(P)H-hydrate epimerase
MEILTSTEMGAADRRTAEQFGVPLAELMENAGTAVARFCLCRYPAAERVLVLCGKGNNGGDGFVAARVLAEAGVDVAVLLLAREDEVKGEADHPSKQTRRGPRAAALARLRAQAPSVAIWPVTGEAALAAASGAIASAELLIDAVVGTGFKPPLRGLPAALRELVVNSAAPVVAVDLPSGWDADSLEQAAQDAFRADAVVTFTAPKLAHVFGHLTRSAFGPVAVAQIGSPAEAIVSTGNLSWAGASKAIARQPREVNANKGKYGHVLVVGGSYGTAGAPSMASLAALRAGAGLVTAAVPKSILELVAGVAPELMLAPLREGPEGALSLENLAADGLKALLKAKKISVVALGPGLSTKAEAPEFVRSFVADCSLPMVIDADALNAFEGKAELLNGSGRTLVLTPHPGEMARLTGLTVAAVEADRIHLARSFATGHKLTLVLKGWRTLIAHPDGRVAVNTSGNPAMAKGGSGDILTGIIAAMLAQFPNDVARAVEAAVALHGLAADFAARAMDEHTVLATDTLAHLSDAFRYRAKDADGLTWICGLNEINT